MKLLRPTLIRTTALICLLTVFFGCDEDPKTGVDVVFYVKTPLFRAERPSFDLRAATPRAPKDRRISVRAKEDFAVGFTRTPGKSVGRFIAQVRVAVGPTKGLRDDLSRGVFQIYRKDAEFNGTLANIQARYTPSINGLTIYTDPEAPIAIPYSDTHEVDLRMEQTDTQLIFSARPHSVNGETGEWTILNTVLTPPTEIPYNLLIGIDSVHKGGQFFFSDLRWEGEAVGGVAEYPVISKIQPAIDAVQAAQAKVAAEPQDLSGALADLDIASVAIGEAVTALDSAVTAGNLQASTRADAAAKLLDSADKSLAKARAKIATLSPAKASAQLKKLDGTSGALKGAFANMLGVKAGNLKGLPDLFSGHIED